MRLKILSLYHEDNSLHFSSHKSVLFSLKGKDKVKGTLNSALILINNYFW